MSCPNCHGLLLLNMTAFGRILGKSRWWVQKRIRTGEFKFIPDGGKRKLIPISQADEWIEKKAINIDEFRARLDGRRKCNA